MRGGRGERGKRDERGERVLIFDFFDFRSWSGVQVRSSAVFFFFLSFFVMYYLGLFIDVGTRDAEPLQELTIATGGPPVPRP